MNQSECETPTKDKRSNTPMKSRVKCNAPKSIRDRPSRPKHGKHLDEDEIPIGQLARSRKDKKSILVPSMYSEPEHYLEDTSKPFIFSKRVKHLEPEHSLNLKASYGDPSCLKLDDLKNIAIRFPFPGGSILALPDEKDTSFHLFSNFIPGSGLLFGPTEGSPLPSLDNSFRSRKNELKDIFDQPDLDITFEHLATPELLEQANVSMKHPPCDTDTLAVKVPAVQEKQAPKHTLPLPEPLLESDSEEDTTSHVPHHYVNAREDELQFLGRSGPGADDDIGAMITTPKEQVDHSSVAIWEKQTPPAARLMTSILSPRPSWRCRESKEFLMTCLLEDLSLRAVETITLRSTLSEKDQALQRLKETNPSRLLIFNLALQREINYLKRKVNCSRRETNCWMKKRNFLRRENHAKKRELSAACRSLESDKKALEAFVSQLKSSPEAGQSTITKLQGQLCTFQDRNTDLESKHSRAIQQINDLETSLGDLQSKFSNYEEGALELMRESPWCYYTDQTNGGKHEVEVITFDPEKRYGLRANISEIYRA
ncbi:LOW QUALITY PROTEIN: hypothetical protein V2J09_000767 [Rumex salicifolius]